MMLLFGQGHRGQLCRDCSQCLKMFIHINSNVQNAKCLYLPAPHMRGDTYYSYVDYPLVMNNRRAIMRTFTTYILLM